MRKIEGFVLIGLYVGKLLGGNTEELMYGEDKRTFKIFELNNLTPFTDASKAEAFREIIRDSFGLESVSLGHIKMSVAESREEWEQVKEKWQKTKSIVVIERIDDLPDWYETRMYGRYLRDKNGEINLRDNVGGVRLRDNGFKPFEDIESAEHCASELIRRGDGNRVEYATFSLERS